MDWKEVKKFLDENKELKEVKDYHSEIAKEAMKGDEFKKTIKEAEEKAVKDFKLKGLDDIIKDKEKEFKAKHLEEFKKEFKIEEPKDPATAKALKDLEDLKKELAEKDRKALRLEAKSKILPKLKGFEDIADHFILDDELKTEEAVNKFTQAVENYTKTRIEESLKKGQYSPPGAAGGQQIQKEVDLSQMTDDQVREYMKNIK